MGVGIHPELHLKILRYIVKELAQLDLPFLNYTQKTANFSIFLEMANIDSFWLFFKNDKPNWANSFTIYLRIFRCNSGCIPTPKIQNFIFWLYYMVYENFKLTVEPLIFTQSFIFLEKSLIFMYTIIFWTNIMTI